MPRSNFRAASLSSSWLRLPKNDTSNWITEVGSFVRDSFSRSLVKFFNFMDEGEDQNKAKGVFNSTFFP
jgi:hypothetical protein